MLFYFGEPFNLSSRMHTPVRAPDQGLLNAAGDALTKPCAAQQVMALGVTGHIWTVADLVQAALEPSDMPPLPKEPKNDTQART